MNSTRLVASITTLLGLSYLGGCGRPAPRDPCQVASYDAQLCQQAVTNHGYFWYGTWYPINYPYGFAWYADYYRTYVIAHPGFVSTTAPPGVYSRSYSSSNGISGDKGTVRGGFGEAGAAHASGGFGGGE